MDQDILRSEIKLLISTLIEIDDFEDDERFVQDLGVDSMMAIEIVASIERKYKIRIPEEKLIEVRTLNDAFRLTSDAIKATS